jgi:peptidyl-prolyl cis-trans isomerase SurA
MRNLLSKSLSMLTATAACMALILSGFTVAAQGPAMKQADGIIAKIGNNIILRSDVEFSYLQHLAQTKQQPNQDLKCQIFASLVQEKLLIARAEIDSVTVSEPEVAYELDNRINYLANQVGGVEKLEAYYNKSTKQLKDELRTSVRDMLVMQEMQKKITSKVKVTPKEIRNYFNRIPADSLPYFSSEVEIGQIVMKAQLSKQQKQETREQLEEIRKRILAGEDFATLAKQYSQDPSTAVKGGELGMMKKKMLVPEYEAAALRLEPGQLSGIVETQFGFHLIQLIERKGQEFNTRHILMRPATATVNIQDAIAELDSIRSLIVNDSISFAKAAKEFSADVNSKDNGGMMMNRSGNTYIPMDQVDPGIFFVIDTMEVGSISKPIPFRMDDGSEAARIIYLKAKSKPHQANMTDDYPRIAQAALADKKSKAVDKWFSQNFDSVFIEIDPEFQQCNVLQLIQ